MLRWLPGTLAILVAQLALTAAFCGIGLTLRRAFGLRRTRYIGQAKTHLQHLLTAAALNLARFVAWVQGIPLAPTRTSAFAAWAQT